MIRVFILDDICLNVDNDIDAQNLIKQGAIEVEDLSIFHGYENLVSPTNTVVNDDGSITFTLPSDEEKEVERAEQELAITENRINEIKEELLTATLLDDTETIDALKAEYKELLNEEV